MPWEQFYPSCARMTNGTQWNSHPRVYSVPRGTMRYMTKNPVHNPRPGRVETHSGRNQTHHRDPERPSEPHILLGSHNLNRWQACWSLFLSRFDFSLIHRPGRHSAKPDAHSRWMDHLTKEEDNRDQVMLPAERFDKSSKLNKVVSAKLSESLAATEMTPPMSR